MACTVENSFDICNC